MNFSDVITERRSVHDYNDEELDRETVEAIIADATLAPSSFNLQPWEFVVVSEDDDRERLQEVAYGQPHVTDAPVVLAVLGNLDPSAHVDRVLDDQVEKGYRTEEGAEATRESVEGMAAQSETERRVWSTKSTALAASQLMLAARARGVASCPMGGFDPEALVEEFGVPDGYEPVMLVTLGYPAEDADDETLPRKFRRPVEEVAHWGEFEADAGETDAETTEPVTDDD
ncbi:nitroreductase family protein [Halorubrum gandharaense]